MRIYLISFLLLLLYTLNVLAKGGGGGGGGGRGGGGGGGSSSGGSRGGGSSSGGSRGGGTSGSGGGSSGSGTGRGSTPAGARSPGGGITAGGGSGSFSSKPSYSSSTSRQTYNSYSPTYSGTYGNGYHSGYVGRYTPGFPYFFIVPSFMFMGYYGAYHRFNSQGAYYAPEINSQGTGSTNLLINGTAYPDDNDNYHYTINATARSDQFPTIDMGFFDSSDLNAHPADFIYRLTMAHVLEYDDVNNNGFYDAQEPILAISSLQKINWQPMILNNRTVPTNTQQTYLETVTAANITYNNTNTSPTTATQPTFGISMTLRFSNLQLNGTASIPIQPNSVQYDVQLQNYPAVATGTNGAVHPRVALAQVVTTKPFTNVVMDVNTTTPVNVAQQIKTNVTYGASIGNYSEGRLEYQPSVTITNMAGISTSTWTNLMDPAQVNRLNDPGSWAWGDNLGVDQRNSIMSLVTFNNQSSQSYQLSGLAYLDTDIISSAINGGSSSTFISSSSRLLVQGTSICTLLVLLFFSF
ncbi:uncharacterized protein BX664DRAFT_271175 [Halteromyces radiatus]|uniref:uncharacterized protein n=1 Tax=Halteromyces radiatus TaxID=101107 RepID=UPI002220680F|nr:uncharacterized protein BX664DRAFT_271175 [Halteromyces radiatus]KAI8098522.1 hypothetical protein BX664DRAFT_271175 [Halteromyces radiatus]